MKMKMREIAALLISFALLLGLEPLGALASEAQTGAPPASDPQIISAFTNPEMITLDIGDTRSEQDVIDTFPKSLAATVEGETEPVSVEVTGWTLVFSYHSSGVFATDENAEIYYEPILDIPEGYTLSIEITQPAQTVQVGEALSHAPQLASAEINPILNVSDSKIFLRVNEDGDLLYSGNGFMWTRYTGTITIKGTGTTTNVVQVQGGEHDIILNGVDIQSDTADFCAFDVQGSATANITLADSSTNTLRSGAGRAGLQVQSGATLSIGGTGSLSATGGSGGAGIGGGKNGDGGNISISGGIVIATGNYGAGIGGGDGRHANNTGNGGTIAISGGKVTATGISGGAGIGGGSGNTSDGTGGNGGSITISGTAEIIEAKSENGGAGIGGGLLGDGDIIQIEGGTIKLAQSTANGAGIGGGAAGNGGSITISGTAKIEKAQGGTNGAGIGGGDGANGAGEGGNGGSITISNTALISEAQGGTYGAGIGGGYLGTGGTITISGGTVTALGGVEGAGIGGGGLGTYDLEVYSGYNAGFVTISGGKVTAVGGDSRTQSVRGGAGAGIGGGARGGNGGTVKILSGMVTARGGSSNDATSTLGSDGGAGIGGGGMGTAEAKEIESAGGIIIISGGTVVATGGTSKAGSGGTGIGNGAGYIGGGTSTFSTSDTNAGNAFVVATGGAGGAGSADAKAISNDGNTSDWSGVIFKGNDGLVYGAPTLATNATIQSGQTLTIENSQTLTVNADITLTNEGTLTNDGTLTGTSTLAGDGTFQINVLKAEYIIGVNASYDYTGSAISVNPTISNPTILGKVFTVNGWNYVIEKQSGGSWAASEVQDYGHYRVRYYKAGATEVIKHFTVGTFDTLSFDKNGGSGTAEDMSIARGTAIGTLPTLTRAGYTFNGWTIDGQSITSATVWNYTVDKTATANWTTIALPAPNMTNGTGQIVQQGQSASFTSNGDFGGYVNTEVTPSGGTPQVVHTKGNNNSDASAVEGSIIVTLSGTYTATLPVGTHSIAINSAGGSATTTFTVVAPAPTPTPTPTSPAISPLTGVDGHENPQTGDNSNTPLLIALMLVSALGLTILFLTRKKYLSIRKKIKHRRTIE